MEPRSELAKFPLFAVGSRQSGSHPWAIVGETGLLTCLAQNGNCGVWLAGRRVFGRCYSYPHSFANSSNTVSIAWTWMATSSITRPRNLWSTGFCLISPRTPLKKPTASKSCLNTVLSRCVSSIMPIGASRMDYCLPSTWFPKAEMRERPAFPTHNCLERWF
jgi:hypothetical protein